MKSMTKMMVVAMILVAALVVAPAAARSVESGDNVFIGEENLNFGGDLAGTTRLIHYTGTVGEASDKIFTVNAAGNITEITKGIPTGTYYSDLGDAATYWVNIMEPELGLDVVLNKSQKDSVDGKSVTRDTLLDFKLTNNIDIDGAEVNIEVTLPGGGVVTYFGGQTLNGLDVDGTTRYYGALDLSGAQAGTYTAVAKWPSNSDFYGKGFDSKPVTFEVSTKALTITSDKDTVVRGNPFSVTITGESQREYLLFVKEVGGLAENEYPLIAPGQNGVDKETDYDGAKDSLSLSTNILNTVPGMNYTQAWVKTSAGGTRTVQFNTSANTDDRQYTIRVQALDDNSTYDEVKVRVEEGSVTITASGTGTYYVGEEITLSGTCTESDTVYLFMTGPNLGSEGVNPETLERLKNAPPLAVDVEGDDTWSYDWETGNLGALEAGGYTIYAVSEPRDRNDLSGAKYATATIQLRPGFVTATVSGATVASGDDIKITGTAQGSTNDVQIWIFGKNFYGNADNSGKVDVKTVSVEDDGTFEYELDNTESLSSGQYFVIVQHPMSDDYAVDVDESKQYLTGPGIPTNSVNLLSLTASAAANAVINALNSPYSDDKYTKLTFFLEDAWIRIDPIGDQSAGSTFTITGTTNLAAGGELIVEVTSAAFQPGAAGETSGFSSDAGTVTIQQGETANTWSFEVDGTTFRPDQYTVTVESIETQTSTSTTFNIVEGTAPTPTGTETTTPTGTETTTPTGTTTTEPTPTQSPGFGALVALAGLGAVAFLVLRRD